MIQKHRILSLSIILAFVVAVATGGWLLGSQIQSPAEAAARTAPPVPAPILVPVEARMLSSDLVARGTARYGLPMSVALVPSTAKGTPGIITTLPLRGTQLQEGDLLLTVSERPVFVLQGVQPIYRDLVIGITGHDVLQLEHALDRLGYDPGPIDETYDEATADAVTAWYQEQGWQPALPTATEQAEILRLTTALSAAKMTLLVAEEALAVAPTEVELAQSNADYANKVAAAQIAAREAAQAALTADPEADTKAAVTTAVAEVAAARAAAVATQLNGELAIQRAANAQLLAEREVIAAQESVKRLTAELAIAEQRSKGYVPADEIVFVPTLPVRIDAFQVDIGDAGQGVLLTVTNNQLAVDSQLSLDEAALIQPGMSVAIDEPDLGIEASGTVAHVADSPGTNGVDGYHVYFEISVNESATDISGFSVRLTIPIESTDGAVTTVPISALSLRANGESVVEVETSGSLEPVVVKPGLAADGMVEVNAVEGELLPGQLVVVGYEAQEQARE